MNAAVVITEPREDIQERLRNAMYQFSKANERHKSFGPRATCLGARMAANDMVQLAHQIELLELMLERCKE